MGGLPHFALTSSTGSLARAGQGAQEEAGSAVRQVASSQGRHVQAGQPGAFTLLVCTTRAGPHCAVVRLYEKRCEQLTNDWPRGKSQQRCLHGCSVSPAWHGSCPLWPLLGAAASFPCMLSSRDFPHWPPLPPLLYLFPGPCHVLKEPFPGSPSQTPALQASATFLLPTLRPPASPLHNRVPQTGWLKTTERYPLAVWRPAV